MNAAVLLRPEQRWECPNCPQTAVTHEVLRPGEGMVRLHRCSGLAGFNAPMVPAGVRCKVEAFEREDYEAGGGLIQRNLEGRPIMAVRTTHDHGYDTAVYAPTVLYDARDDSTDPAAIARLAVLLGRRPPFAETGS